MKGGFDTHLCHVILTFVLYLQEKKKLIDCFPHDLDVDKFLSSLHYDEWNRAHQMEKTAVSLPA